MLLVKNMTLQGRARFITQVTGGTGGNAATDKEIKGMGKTGESVTERNQALARVMQVEKAMLVEQERRAEEDRWTEVVTADKGTGTGCQCSPISQCITRRWWVSFCSLPFEVDANSGYTVLATHPALSAAHNAKVALRQDMDAQGIRTVRISSIKSTGTCRESGGGAENGSLWRVRLRREKLSGKENRR